MTPLEQLRDAVRALTGAADVATAHKLGFFASSILALSDGTATPAIALRDAVQGSIDAAERFRAAVLPGWCIQVRQLVSSTREHYYITLTEPAPIKEIWDKPHVRVDHPCESIARVLATLSALIAKQAPDET